MTKRGFPLTSLLEQEFVPGVLSALFILSSQEVTGTKLPAGREVLGVAQPEEVAPGHGAVSILASLFAATHPLSLSCHLK